MKNWILLATALFLVSVQAQAEEPKFSMVDLYAGCAAANALISTRFEVGEPGFEVLKLEANRFAPHTSRQLIVLTIKQFQYDYNAGLTPWADIVELAETCLNVKTP